MANGGTIRIGISGWRYAPWRGVFYPKGLPQRRELAYAAAIFAAVEINGTFYSLQRPADFARWSADTPPTFVFAIKGPRYLTHILRLKEVEIPLANFLAQGLLGLGPKLGPLLWQLPASFRLDLQRLERFFELLPRDTAAALALARRHDRRLDGRASLAIDTVRPLRHAIEIRHPSFAMPEFVDLLRRYGIALVCSDAVGWPRLMEVTSDFVYCRLHGAEELYASGYDALALDAWAARVRAWAAGGEPTDADHVAGAARPDRRPREVYLFFDNDAKVRAPFDAISLAERLARSRTDELPAPAP